MIKTEMAEALPYGRVTWNLGQKQVTSKNLELRIATPRLRVIGFQRR